jgi:hypothetical protein
MPLSLQWDDEEHTILRQTVSGRWTQEEYQAMYEDMVVLYRSVPHDIDLIIDVSKNETNPLGMLYSMNSNERKVEPNHHSVTLVGSNTIIRVVANVASKIAPNMSRGLYFADTLDEAYARIAKSRAQEQEKKAKAGD